MIDPAALHGDTILDLLYGNLLEREPWRQHANCRGLDPDIFFPKRGRGNTEEAKAICAACTVRMDCLESGLTEDFGVRGGQSTRERKRMRRTRKAA